MVFHWIFFLLSIFLLPISTSAQTNGSVAAGTTLNADEKSSPWLSPLGDFAFGFKQLQDKDQFLFSIWFNKIPDQTVVWYLNTINPVVPRGSSIRVDSKAGLVLLDPQDGVLWSTTGIDVQTDQGFLENTGNFILKGSDGSLLWESFKVYADTILPGQELAIGDALHSRHSEKNFTNGRFHLRFVDGNLVLTSQSAESDKGDDYYSSRTSEAGNSSNSGSRAGLDQRGSIYVMRKNGQITPVSSGLPAPASYYIRATLEFDGLFLLYSHPRSFTATSAIWNAEWSEPNNICEAIMGWQEQSGACGYNNICSLQGVRSSCSCPIGYHLVDPNDKYGDCQPNFTASCEEQESDLVMLEQANIDWPLADYSTIHPATEVVCKQACLDDCLCAVAIFRANQCWKKKFPLANGKVYPNSKAFIKSGSRTALPPYTVLPRRSKPKDKATWVVVGSVLGGCSLFVLVLVAAILFAFYKGYQKRNKITRAGAVETSLCCFTFQELAEATREFGEELGSGSFGVVYKGKLLIRSRSVHVAVKKLNRLAQEKEFRAEVNSIGQTNHKNLVRLLGFCDEGKHRLLVYEYMSNGSLASFLFSENKPSWSMRKHIATGIARGLEYLHEECSVQIIHCDIKPENILLDEYYNVRISDFGLAKLMDTDQSRATLTNIRGTRGYIAPEWFSNSQITAKVDVYSFGVLLLEIVSCRKRIKRVEIAEEQQTWDSPLTDLAWDCFQQQCLDSFVGNDDMEPLKDEMMLEKYVMVGLWCIQENPSLRPTMRKVSQLLEGIVEVEIPPCPNPVSRSV